MAVSHRTKTTQAESAAAGDVSATAWNEDHNAPPEFIHAFVISAASPITATSMPAAVTEQGGVNRRTIYDFTNINEVRLVGSVSTVSASGEVRVRYSADGGTTWRYFDAAQAGPALALTPVGVRASAWVALESGAKGDRMVQLVTVNGTGATSPVIAELILQGR